MSQDLAEYGIYFNELDKLCILEPEVYKQTNNLNEECKSYFQKIEEFQKLTDVFVGMVEKLSKEVEKEKMKAIGAHNILQSMEKEKQTSQQQLQALIAEKSMELERLKILHNSLLKAEMEQNDILNRLTHY